MELKLGYRGVVSISKRTFNRTSMELKLNTRRTWKSKQASFNRTSMELKRDRCIQRLSNRKNF